MGISTLHSNVWQTGNRRHTYLTDRTWENYSEIDVCAHIEMSLDASAPTRLTENGINSGPCVQFGKQQSNTHTNTSLSAKVPGLDLQRVWFCLRVPFFHTNKAWNKYVFKMVAVSQRCQEPVISSCPMLTHHTSWIFELVMWEWGWTDALKINIFA